MSDESVPHIQQTNELLNGLLQQAVRTEQALERQGELLEKGFGGLQSSVKEQTQTLGELEIISCLAELETLKVLIATEEEAVLQETAEDASAISDLEESFERIRVEIEERRNQQVRHLLQDLFTLWEGDLEGRLEPRSRVIAEEVLDEFRGQIDDGVRARREALHESIEKTEQTVRAYIEQREAVVQAAAELQNDVGSIGQRYGAPSLLAVPIYLVETERVDGSSEVVAWPVPRRRVEPTSPSGVSLESPNGFEAFREILAKRGRSLLRKAAAGERARRVTWTPELSVPSVPGWLASMVRRLLAGALRERPIERILPEAHDPRTVFEATLTDPPAEPTSPPPSSATVEPEQRLLEEAAERIRKDDLHGALELFDRLLAEGVDLPIVHQGRAYCERRLQGGDGAGDREER